MIESLLYQKLKNGETQCRTCNHYCVISPDQRGICGVRENQKGGLYFLAGKIIACHIDPIEKKPLYHFLPRSFTYSIAAAGCNFRCDNCQNWTISQAPKFMTKDKWIKQGDLLTPQQIVQEALKYQCPSISYTYTEPTIFLELALATMKIARQNNLKNIWVTNGFMSKETLDLILPYLDAANMDLKSFDEKFYQRHCGAKLKPILENLKKIKKAGVWLEITTLIIPSLSDQPTMLKKIARFIKDDLGAETPWHISRFFPEVSYKLKNLSATPLESIETACRIGREAGLKYVYKGNV